MLTGGEIYIFPEERLLGNPGELTKSSFSRRRRSTLGRTAAKKLARASLWPSPEKARAAIGACCSVWTSTARRVVPSLSRLEAPGQQTPCGPSRRAGTAKLRTLTNGHRHGLGPCNWIRLECALGLGRDAADRLARVADVVARERSAFPTRRVRLQPAVYEIGRIPIFRCHRAYSGLWAEIGERTQRKPAAPRLTDRMDPTRRFRSFHTIKPC